MADTVNQEINVNINALVKRIQDVREFVALIRSLREQRGGPVVIDERISRNAKAGVSDVTQLAGAIEHLNASINSIDDKQPTRFSNAIKLLSSVVQGLAAAGQAVDFVKSWIPGFEKVKESGSEAFLTVKDKASLFAASAGEKGAGLFASLRSGATALIGSLRGVVAGSGGVVAALGTAGVSVGIVTGGILLLVAAVTALVAGFALLIGTIGGLTAGLVALGTISLLPLLQFGAEYNAQLEQAKLGIGAIIASLAEFRNEAGQTIEGPEKLNAALTLAQDQISKLKVDAINTIATFAEILPAFQTAIGPGLRAGLELDQVRQIVVRIVQAAGAIGLPANQIAQEVRAILEGTINEDARLAKILGISNELVKTWKEQGTLAEELNKRLDQFGEAGILAAQTLDGLTSNLQEAVNVFAGQATERAFDRLKTRIAAILNEIFDFKKAGLNESFATLASFIDDLFVRAIDIAGDFINEVIQGAKEIAGWIQSNRGTLDEVLATVGEIVSLIGYVILELARVAARLLGSKSTLDLINQSLSFTRNLVVLISATILGLADAFAFVVNYIKTNLHPALTLALVIAEKIARALGVTPASSGPNVGADVGGGEGIFRPGLPKFSVRPPAPAAKKKGSASANKPADTLDAEFALRSTLAERDFNLERDLIERLTEIYRTALDTRKISTEEYFRALEGFRRRELEAEITLNEKLLQIEKERRDAELKKIAADKDSTPAQKTALRTNVENKFKDTTAQIEEKLKILARTLGGLPGEIEVAETAALRTLDDQITAFLAKVDAANGKTAEAAANLIDLEFRDLLEKVTIEQGENSPLVQLIKEFIQLQKDRARVQQIDEQLQPLGQQFEIDRLAIETRVSKELITQKQGRREINELQKKYLEAQLEILKNELAATKEARLQLEIKLKIANVENAIANLKEVNSTAREINDSLRHGLEDFFASIADGTKTIKQAFGDLGNYILQLFARLAARKLVESIFGGLFGDKDGEGGLGGILAGIFGGKKAAGDMMSARPGGQLIQVAEAGYDELVVTTDPKYAGRTSGLLGAFIRRTGIIPDIEQFAAGGFAHRIANTFTTSIPRLAAGAFVTAAGPETALAGIGANSGPSEFLIKQFNIYDPNHVHDAMRHEGGDAVFWNFIDHNATEIRQRLKVRT